MIGDHVEGLGFLKGVTIDQHVLRRNRQFDLIPVIEAAPGTARDRHRRRHRHRRPSRPLRSSGEQLRSRLRQSADDRTRRAVLLSRGRRPVQPEDARGRAAAGKDGTRGAGDEAAMEMNAFVSRTLAFGLAAVLSQGQAPARSSAPDVAPQVSRAIDSLFARWNTTALPGCTIGVSLDGRQVVSRAYGMADLEHGIANQPDSIIEAGSVSKQFTAAAVLLLAQQGQAVARRPGAQVHPRAPRLRRASDHPPSDHPYLWPAGLGDDRGHRRLAAHVARLHARACPRHRQPSEGAEFHAGDRVFRTRTPATTSPRSSSPGSPARRSPTTRARRSSSRSA